MPNQRSSTKVMIGAFIEKALYEDLKKMAKKERKTLTDFLTELLQEETQRQKPNIASRDEINAWPDSDT